MAYITEEEVLGIELSYSEALELIRKLEFVSPGDETAVAIHGMIEKKHQKSKRTFALDNIKKRPDGLCVWCLKNKLTGRQQKYCSYDCKMSAWMYSNPQSDQTKAYVLIYRQDCACAACGLSYEELIIKGVKRMLKRKAEWEKLKEKYGWMGEFDPWLGALVDNTGHIIQVDHIVPIFKGGAAVGLSNIQVICTGCHTTKTASERK